ncbi:hypothetical protein V7S43_002245 [Phytophthora oleae]|uniref:Uncharacterized protein n=1 Tax=Phytophthora oleae TaxID=2107226 RepID=A0ABD3G1I2_9STRA
MDYLDAARRAPWVVVYLAAGVGVLVNLLGEVYSNALGVCEMYPQFSFYDTVLEELSMHHTRLPLVRVHVPTLHLLGAYTAAYAAKYWGLLDRGWPLLLDLLSGRWLYHQLFEILPAYLPFVFSEPDVPELLSEDEASGLEEEDDFDDVPPSPPVDNDACNEALAKLVQVKMQHANRTIPRPDDWLVFDPVQEKLVLQKHATHVNGTVLNGHNNGHAGGKVSLPRAQEPLGDNQAAAATCAAAMRVEKDVDTEAAMNQPQEVATGIRKRL